MILVLSFRFVRHGGGSLSKRYVYFVAPICTSRMRWSILACSPCAFTPEMTRVYEPCLRREPGIKSESVPIPFTLSSETGKFRVQNCLPCGSYNSNAYEV